MKVRNKKKELLAAKRYYDKNKQRIRLLARHRRRSDVAGSIVIDSRKGDRRAGRENDLDREFVASLIAHPCEYCGDDVLRKTLDRIDNSIGHVRTNVVCACERCNYIRRAMPQQAWEHVAVAVREARELGLFGEWTGAIHRRLELEPKPVPVGVGPRPW